MPILDNVNVSQLIENSNISKAFGIDVNSFLILILGSFIVGYICLTFYYMVYNDHSNKKWNELNSSEKAIVSLVIGFLSILSSQYVVAIYQIVNNNDKNLEQLFLQLNYIFPFIYFIIISILANAKKNYLQMEFIKVYIQISAILISCLNFTFLLIILYIIRSWYGILMLTILILIIWLINTKKINEIYYLFNFNFLLPIKKINIGDRPKVNTIPEKVNMNKQTRKMAIVVCIPLFFLIISIFLIPSSINAINASFTGILVYVTFLYLIETKSILNEQKTSRKIELIEKSLEKLYYPLIDFLKSDIRVHNTVDGIIQIGGRRPHNMQNYEIKDFFPYLYLASNDLKSPLNDFIEMISDFNPKEMNGQEIKELEKQVNEIVNNDVQKFKKQLIILIV